MLYAPPGRPSTPATASARRPFFLAGLRPAFYLSAIAPARTPMARPSTHEALIYLMVITSASDRDMLDVELARIGEVVRSAPIFVDFDPERLIEVARDCQRMLSEDRSLEGLFMTAAKAIPARLHDTAYALAVEVANVDLEMRMEEVRVLERLRRHLDIDENTAAAIERAAKARHRSLT
jgi:tellurite resistance protein